MGSTTIPLDESAGAASAGAWDFSGIGRALGHELDPIDGERSRFDS